MKNSFFKNTVFALVFIFPLVSCHPNNNGVSSSKESASSIIDSLNSSSYSLSTEHENNCIISYYCDGKYLGKSIAKINDIIGPDYNYSNVMKQFSGSFFGGWYLDSTFTKRVAENYRIVSNQLNLFTKIISVKDAILNFIKKKGTINVTGPSPFNSTGNVHYNSILDEVYADCNFSTYEIQTKLSNGYSSFAYILSEDVFDVTTNSIVPAGTVLASGEFNAVVTFIAPQRREFGGIQFKIDNLQYTYYYSKSFVSSNIADTFEGILNLTFDDFVPTSYNFGKETGLFMIE